MRIANSPVPLTMEDILLQERFEEQSADFSVLWTMAEIADGEQLIPQQQVSIGWSPLWKRFCFQVAQG